MVPTTDSSEVSRTFRECAHDVTAGWEVSRRAQRRLGDAGHPCWYQEQDCSKGCCRDRLRRAKAQWTESAVRGACDKHCRTSLSDCTRRHNKERSMGLVQAKRGSVENRVRRVSQKCFNTVGRARSRSKTCGANGSRKSRSVHKGH